MYNYEKNSPEKVGCIEYRKTYARQGQKAWISELSSSRAILLDDKMAFTSGDRLQITFAVGDRKRSVPAIIEQETSVGWALSFADLSNQDTQIIEDFIYFCKSAQKDKKDLLFNIFEKCYL